MSTEVEVYFNLHKHLFSVRSRQTGLVIAHESVVRLTDVTFRVSEAGRQRVLRERKKNVHAFVRGTVDTLDSGWRHWHGEGEAVAARYNPYEGPHFVSEGGSALAGAGSVLMVALGGKAEILTFDPIYLDTDDKV